MATPTGTVFTVTDLSGATYNLHGVLYGECTTAAATAFIGTEKKLAFSGTQGNVSVSGTPNGSVSAIGFSGTQATITSFVREA